MAYLTEHDAACCQYATEPRRVHDESWNPELARTEVVSCRGDQHDACVRRRGSTMSTQTWAGTPPMLIESTSAPLLIAYSIPRAMELFVKRTTELATRTGMTRANGAPRQSRPVHRRERHRRLCLRGYSLSRYRDRGYCRSRLYRDRFLVIGPAIVDKVPARRLIEILRKDGMTGAIARVEVRHGNSRITRPDLICCCAASS